MKAGSLQKVQEAESKLRSAEMFLEIAKAGVKRAEIHLRYLGLSLSGCRARLVSTISRMKRST